MDPITYSFDSSLTPAQAKASLQGLPANSACPVGGGNIAISQGGQRLKIVSAGEAEQYTSKVDTDVLQRNLLYRLKKYEEYLPGMSSKELQLEGDKFSVAVSDHEGPRVVCLTDKNSGLFFDLVVFRVSPSDVVSKVTYKDNCGGGMFHSGDIGSLLHFVTIKPEEGCVFMIGFVGYRKTRLVEFSCQAPAAIIAGDDGLYAVPLSISRADVGDSTFAIVAAMSYEPESCSWRVTAVPSCNAPGIDTCSPTSLTMSLTTAARKHHLSAGSNAAPEGSVFSLQSMFESAGLISRPADKPRPPTAASSDYTVAVFRQRGTTFNLTDFTACHEFGAGSRLRDHHVSKINLPCLFGPCNPCSSLALGVPVDEEDSYSWDDLRASLDASSAVFVVVDDDWLSTVASSCEWRCDGLYIIQDKVYHNVIKRMESINRTGVVMAGPRSLILYQQGHRYYYYAGMTHGLFADAVYFGDDVTDRLVSALPSWIESGGMGGSPCPRVSPKDDRAILYGDKAVKMEELPVSDMFEIGVSAEVGRMWLDVVHQLSMMLPPNELAKASELLSQGLVRSNRSASSPILSEMKEARERVVSFPDDKEAKKKLGALVGSHRALKRMFGEISAAVQGMVSMTAGRSKAADISKLERKMEVNAGVKKAMSKSREEVMDSFSNVDQWVICEIDDEFGNLVTGASDVDSDISVAHHHERCPSLDGDTVYSLVATENGAGHPLAGDESIAFAIDALKSKSMLSLPVFDFFTGLLDPSAIRWIDISADHEMCKLWRIRTRHTIASSKWNRERRLYEGSREIGMIIVKMLLSVMSNMSSCVQDVSGLSFDDGVPTMMRGVFCLALSVLSSGTAPLSMAWQIVTPGNNLDVVPTDAWIVSGLAKAFPYTKWSPVHLNKKLSLLFVSTLRKKLVLPAVKRIESNASAIKESKASSRKNARDQELHFLGVAYEVTKLIIDSGKNNDAHDDELRGVGQRLAALAPKGSTRSSVAQCLRFAEAMRDGRTDWNNSRRFADTVYTLVRASLKYSAEFKKSKLALVAACSSKRAAVASNIEEREAKLGKYAGRSVRIQNRTILDPGCTKMVMNGDAELVRTRWSVSGDDKASDRVDASVLAVWGREPPAKEEKAGDREVAARPEESDPVLAHFEEYGRHADDARHLLKSCDSITASDAISMCRIGKGEEHYRILYGDAKNVGGAIRALLHNFDNPSKGQEIALEMVSF